MGNQLKELAAVGQSIWLDNIRRSMFASGELARLLDVGLRGMTSNPTIFEKAIGTGNDYDAQLAELIGKESDPTALFEALAIQDIRAACDAFEPVYRETHKLDGYVSLEVSPTLAHDTDGTIAAAERLWKAVDRANVMIKIPGTPEGVPAIRATIAKGINVNVTLLFSPDRYAAAAEAYIAGLEDRVARSESVEGIASVASVFVSRIDTAIDKLLQARIEKGEKLEGLLGKAGVANLKLTYQRFLSLFESERFAALRAKGAAVQRPLWASTSTKNPLYDDLMYITTVVGKDTVNTVPPPTLDALLDHGTIVADTVLTDISGARATIESLGRITISVYDITERLVAEGVTSFAASFTAMLEAISYKQQQLAGGTSQRVRLSLGAYEAAAATALDGLESGDFLNKLWKHDASPWSSEPDHVVIIKNALGWVDIPAKTASTVGEMREFATSCAKTFKHVVVLGMGGSSLAPDTLRATYGHIAGFPQLHVLDSTDTAQIEALDAAIDLETTLFIVASKSGTTTEPEAFFRYYYERVQKRIGEAKAGPHFIAITDPGTKLDADARAHHFLRVFTNAADIGGRYSALSYFGMVPAALAGYDVGVILDRANGAMHANATSVKPADAPGTRFGAAIGALAKAGIDKLTIVAHPAIAAFGAWAEQLIAESTGKSNIGIIPIDGEPLGAPTVYGNDRVFVYVGADLAGANADDEAKLAALEAAGKPVIRLAMNNREDIGEQFYLWEIATAAAGSIIGIDAFDQPNVQESKDNTKRLLGEYAQAGGTFNEPAAAVHDGTISVYPLSGSKTAAFGSDLNSAVAAITAHVRAGDYVAINAYIAMNDDHKALLHDLRMRLRDALKVATTVGFGPRFLHSTGQLHKGGPNSGVFFQLTGDPPHELAIPGMVGFRTLERAQALGDFESLDKRDRRGARFHLGSDIDANLRRLIDAVDAALAART